MKRVGIYKIENIVTGDFYIGSSVNIQRRWWAHISDLNCNSHRASIMQEDYNKYGRNCFEFKIILLCEPCELNRYERQIINHLRPLYNTRRGPGYFENNPYEFWETEKQKAAKVINFPYHRRGVLLCEA